MCDLCGNNAPEPPNPFVTAGLQTAQNVSTALAGARLGAVNQNTPQGSLNYTFDNAAGYDFTDPITNHTYRIPQITANQSFTPTGQQTFDTQQRAALNMAQLGEAQSGRLRGMLDNPFSPSGATPAAGDPNRLLSIPQASTTFGATPGLQTSIGDYGRQQTAFGDGGAITRTYGPADDFSADRLRVEEGLYGRLNPQLERERGNIEQRLADQGIRYGSQAYASAMDDYNRQANDARLGVIAQGGAEQSRLMDLEARRAGFQNSAQQQAYEQAQGRGQFANQAQAQQFQEQLAAAGFSNEAIQNIFQQAALRGQFSNAGLAQQMAQQQAFIGAQNTARAQSLTEQYQQRNQPINEITALLSGSQVQQPQFVTTPQNQIPTVDIAGLINQNFNQNFQNYAQQSQNTNNLIGGVLGLGAGALRGGYLTSDVRAKEDIVHMGSVFAAGDDGERKVLPIYEYSYKPGVEDSGARRHVGPMAQDVERIDKRAVSRDRSGLKRIDTGRTMGDILKAA